MTEDEKTRLVLLCHALIALKSQEDALFRSAVNDSASTPYWEALLSLTRGYSPHELLRDIS